MKLLTILFGFVYIISYFHVYSLSQYCSSINTEELFNSFENCINLKSVNSSSLSKMATADHASFSQSYYNITNILKRVFASLDEGGSAKNDNKQLFLDLLRLVKLAKSHSKLDFCFTSICSLFKNCEFPLQIEYKNFENDAMVASRIAALLTAFTFNEKLESKIYLTKTNLYSLLRHNLAENEDIYDIKIAFIRTPDQERFIFHALKNLDKKG